MIAHGSNSNRKAEFLWSGRPKFKSQVGSNPKLKY